MAIFNSYVKLPEGRTSQSPIRFQLHASHGLSLSDPGFDSPKFHMVIPNLRLAYLQLLVVSQDLKISNANQSTRIMRRVVYVFVCIFV